MTLPTLTPGTQQGSLCVVEGEGPGSAPFSDFLAEHQAGFEGLQAEECGILNGCENGRCVRVQEGYTCDCFEGFQLDMAHMACVGKFSLGAAMPGQHRCLPEGKSDWPLLTLGMDAQLNSGPSSTVAPSEAAQRQVGW